MIDEAIRKRNEPTNQPNKFFFFFWSDPRAVPHHSHIERREDGCGVSRPLGGVGRGGCIDGHFFRFVS